MRRKALSPFPIWSGLSGNQLDLKTHFWYNEGHGRKRRLCDDFEAVGELQESSPTKLFIPCKACQGLYAEDIAFGRQILEYLPHPSAEQATYTPDYMLYAQQSRGHPTQSRRVNVLKQPVIGMATFARFYDAPASGKGRVITDARTYVAKPNEYNHRAYYWALRNTLSQTHWKSNDLSDFSDAVEGMLSNIKKEHRVENYRKVSEAYLSFWTKQGDAQFFKIPTERIEIAGLTILINPEIGLRRPGDNLALKVWFSAPKPKRSYRQAIQYLMNEAQQHGWQPGVQPALWDVRREEIMPSVPIAKDFPLVIRGQAAAFREMWGAAGIDESILEEEI